MVDGGWLMDRTGLSLPVYQPSTINYPPSVLLPAAGVLVAAVEPGPEVVELLRALDEPVEDRRPFIIFQRREVEVLVHRGAQRERADDAGDLAGVEAHREQPENGMLPELVGVHRCFRGFRREKGPLPSERPLS